MLHLQKDLIYIMINSQPDQAYVVLTSQKILEIQNNNQPRGFCLYQKNWGFEVFFVKSERFKHVNMVWRFSKYDLLTTS